MIAARLVAARLLAAVPVLAGVSALTFLMVEALPGGTAQNLLGPDAGAEQVRALEIELGLGRSAPQRYLMWIGGALRGDFGTSLASGQPVSALLRDAAAVTGELIALALVAAVSLALFAALLGARNPRGAADRIGAVIGAVGLAAPSYLVALLLVLVLSVHAGWFPSIGFIPAKESLAANLLSLALPAAALGLPHFALYARYLRVDLLGRMHAEGHVVAARARGLGPWRVLTRHALPGSLLGFFTVVGLDVGSLLGGTLIIEQIFGLPGLGRLLLEAASVKDFVVVQAVVLLAAACTVLATLCVDVSYVIVDPRTRDGGG